MKFVAYPRYVPLEGACWRVFNLSSGQKIRIMLLACLHLGARRSEIFRFSRKHL